MSKNIFHYTKDENFLNIINECKFRAVLSTQSNDYKDTILLNELLIESTKDIIEEVLRDSDYFTLDGLIKILNDLFTQFNNDRKSNFSDDEKSRKCFVVCFTDKKDSRFLWNSYTKNEGVNIKFDYTSLKSNMEEYSKNQRTFEYFKLEQVIYDYKEQIRMVKKIVNKNYNLYMKSSDDSLSNMSMLTGHKINFTDTNGNILYRGNTSNYLITLKKSFVDFAIQTINQLLDLAPYIKHSFWEEEREYRLTLYRAIKCEYLSDVLIDMKKDDKGNKIIYHYIELPYDKELIKEVKIGPLSRFTKDDLNHEDKNIHEDCIVSESSGKGVLKY